MQQPPFCFVAPVINFNSQRKGGCKSLFLTTGIAAEFKMKRAHQLFSKVICLREAKADYIIPFWSRWLIALGW
jgi:hypothetical protein